MKTESISTEEPRDNLRQEQQQIDKLNKEEIALIQELKHLPGQPLGRSERAYTGCFIAIASGKLPAEIFRDIKQRAEKMVVRIL